MAKSVSPWPTTCTSGATLAGCGDVGVGAGAGEAGAGAGVGGAVGDGSGVAVATGGGVAAGSDGGVTTTAGIALGEPAGPGVAGAAWEKRCPGSHREGSAGRAPALYSTPSTVAAAPRIARVVSAACDTRPRRSGTSQPLRETRCQRAAGLWGERPVPGMIDGTCASLCAHQRARQRAGASCGRNEKMSSRSLTFVFVGPVRTSAPAGSR